MLVNKYKHSGMTDLTYFYSGTLYREILSLLRYYLDDDLNILRYHEITGRHMYKGSASGKSWN
jgi:hypothetical protein